MFSTSPKKRPLSSAILILGAVAVATISLPAGSLADEGHGHKARQENRGAGMHGDGHMEDGHANDGHAHSIAGGEPGDPSEVERTIRIDARDIAFDRKQIRVRAGETVRFVITNTGSLMHDFTLGTRELQHEHRQEMLRMMQQGMQPGQMEHDDPNAVTVGPGETRELVWKFAEAKNFEFGCNIPGHYEAGMKGEILIDGKSS